MDTKNQVIACLLDFFIGFLIYRKNAKHDYILMEKVPFYHLKFIEKVPKKP